MFWLLKVASCVGLGSSNLSNEVWLIGRNVELVWFVFLWLALIIYLVHTFSPTGYVNHIKTHIAVSTWQDVFCMMSAVFVVNFALLVIYLLVACSLNFIRRLWWVVWRKSAVCSRSQCTVVINSVQITKCDVRAVSERFSFVSHHRPQIYTLHLEQEKKEVAGDFQGDFERICCMSLNFDIVIELWRTEDRSKTCTRQENLLHPVNHSKRTINQSSIEAKENFRQF